MPASDATLGTRLLLESDVTTPLGQVTLLGTSSGPTRVRNRVLGAYAWVYAVAGLAAYRDELGTEQLLHPGDALLIFPGLRHTYEAVSGSWWEQIYFTFNGPVFNLLESNGVIDRASPVHRVEPITEWLHTYLDFANRRRPSTEAEGMILVGEFMQLLVSSLARSSRPQGWLGRARALLDAEIDQPMRLEVAAGELGVSVETFRKRFRRESGEPPAQYRARRRLATARELLRSTSLSLREIAAMLGYSDEFHLSKRFKEATGQSPREFRRSAQPSPGVVRTIRSN